MPSETDRVITKLVENPTNDETAKPAAPLPEATLSTAAPLIPMATLASAVTNIPCWLLLATFTRVNTAFAEALMLGWTKIPCLPLSATKVSDTKSLLVPVDGKKAMPSSVWLRMTQFSIVEHHDLTVRERFVVGALECAARCKSAAWVSVVALR